MKTGVLIARINFFLPSNGKFLQIVLKHVMTARFFVYVLLDTLSEVGRDSLLEEKYILSIQICQQKYLLFFFLSLTKKTYRYWAMGTTSNNY